MYSNNIDKISIMKTKMHLVVGECSKTIEMRKDTANDSLTVANCNTSTLTQFNTFHFPTGISGLDIYQDMIRFFKNIFLCPVFHIGVPVDINWS